MRVFELYSGIGGMHFALLESGINADIFKAIDINTTANTVYKHNFPRTILLEKNIQGLTEADFNKFDIEMILMSPPCQPHTRNGLKRDKSDQRSDSLLHFLTLIPKFNTVKYILLENVKGFEESVIRDELISVLNESSYIFQEFLLSPTQFSIPNSRLRYYLLAKRKPLKFCFQETSTVMNELPVLRNDLQNELLKLNWKYKKLCIDNSCFPVGLILDEGPVNIIPDNVLQKYGTLFDIVTDKSVKSCCFTKGYTHFVEGTGSVLTLKNSDFIEKVFQNIKNSQNSDNSLDLLKNLHLRYFTPKEISRLLCFPENLTFPNCVTDKQKYRLLGNSINVHVVAMLIKILVS